MYGRNIGVRGLNFIVVVFSCCLLRHLVPLRLSRVAAGND